MYFIYGSLLTRVGSNVSLQQPRPREALAAEVALAALVVGAHVHAVGGYADVHLVAVGTAAGLFVAERAVGLPVPRQIGRGRVFLAAVRALVFLLAAAQAGTRALLLGQLREVAAIDAARRVLHLLRVKTLGQNSAQKGK